jgi:hypothetical protein
MGIGVKVIRFEIIERLQYGDGKTDGFQKVQEILDLVLVRKNGHEGREAKKI